VPAVLVTHADEPLGRRIVKTLFHDERVERVLALGAGAAPRSFDRFLAGSPPRVAYARVDLAKHRPMADLFHSARFREAGIDTVVHVPSHGPSGALASKTHAGPLVSGVPSRTAEARLVLQHSLDARSVTSLIVIGSAFVYRLVPGNANRLSETNELDLDPNVPAEIRSWIDCDMVFHAEVGNHRARVVLLRVPTVVASGGFVYLNPALSGPSGLRLRPIGFDPMCAVVAEQDVARAVLAAVHGGTSGVYNVAGTEHLPLSVLGRWTRRPTVPVPDPVLRAASFAARMLREPQLRASVEGAHLRYGFSLDTRRAERDLGFRPGYRVGLGRAGDGRVQLETAPV
jgi:nucleoside-diphosphate-sugar epimerase